MTNDFTIKQFEGSFDYIASGDDGEEDFGEVKYRAKIDDFGHAVVDPASIKVHVAGVNPSSKLGHDVDSDTEIQDSEELLQLAQYDLKIALATMGGVRRNYD